MRVRHTPKSFFSLILSCALAVSSAGYLFHWYYRLNHSELYVWILSYMPLSCAFTFFLSAICLLALEFDKKLICFIGGVFITLSSAGDFLQSTTNAGFDFDLVLSSIFYPNGQLRFYQMAPNSALAFTFAGIAFVMLSKKKNSEFSVFLANAFGGLSAGLGMVSLIGHWTGAVSAYTWENFVGMSGHTASLFLLLGLAISLNALSKVSLRQRRIHVPLFIALSLMLVTLQLYRSQTQAEKITIMGISEERVSGFRDHMKRDLEEHAFEVVRVANAWNLQGGVPKAVWYDDARSLVKFSTGFNRLCWVDQTGVDRWCAPEISTAELREGILANLDQAKSNAFFLIPPNDKEPNFKVAVPVTRKNKPDGYFVGTLQLSKLFSRNYNFSNYLLTVEWDGHEVFRSLDEAVEKSWTASLNLMEAGLQFKISVAPLPHEITKIQSKLPLIFLLIGIAFAWAMAYASYLFIITRENARESQDLLAWEQAISKGSDLIFITFDKLGLIRSFNPAAERFFEEQARDVIDLKSPLDWLDPAELAKRREALIAETGDKSTTELDAVLKDAKKGLVDRKEWTLTTQSGHLKKGELSIHSLRSERNEIVGYVGIVRDITEQREAEAKLIQSSKMASLGEMAGGIAHEINNPLTIIQGRVIRLLQLSERADGVSLQQLQDQMQIVLDTCRRIAKIVKGLATFSRDSTLDLPEPAELDVIIQDTIELCRERFNEHGVTLKTPHLSDVIIFCRPTQISQVLLNLLNNAFDAVLHLPECWVEVTLHSSEPGKVHLCVTDSGPGIPPEVLAKMMQPFFTTKEVGKGTGLGLSISKGIMDSHGGRLYVDTSSPNTRFIMELSTYA